MASFSDKTFALTTPVDMLAKLEWEWDKMRSFDIREHSYEKAYFAINAATTAWHICDWLAASLTDQQFERLSTEAGTLIADMRSLRAWAMKECLAFSMCDQIANGAKHFAIKPRAESYTAQEREFFLGELRTHYLMVEGGGSLVSIDFVIGTVYKFWKEVFLATGLATSEDVEYPLRQRAWDAKRALGFVNTGREI